MFEGKSCSHSRAFTKWIRQLVERRGKNRTAVAVANKNARIVWALLTSHQAYEPAKG